MDDLKSRKLGHNLTKIPNRANQTDYPDLPDFEILAELNARLISELEGLCLKAS